MGPSPSARLGSLSRQDETGDKQGPVETLAIKGNKRVEFAQEFIEGMEQGALFAQVAQEVLAHDEGERPIIPSCQKAEPDEEDMSTGATRKSGRLNIKEDQALVREMCQAWIVAERREQARCHALYRPERMLAMLVREVIMALDPVTGAEGGAFFAPFLERKRR